MSGTILTNQGCYFTFKKPEEHVFLIEEIAHALSNICRYTGHVRKFYSVAQHSVLVSYLVPKHLAMCGLMHDASEAYLGDVSTNLKVLLPEYKALEERVEALIAKQYGLPFPLPAAVKKADMQMLATEKRDLMPRTPTDELNWPKAEPIKYTVRPMEPELARLYFMNRYNQLMKGS